MLSQAKIFLADLPGVDLFLVSFGGSEWMISMNSVYPARYQHAMHRPTSTIAPAFSKLEVSFATLRSTSAIMSLYLLSEGLTFLGIFSGEYESLKVLSRAEKGIETSTLSGILEFWVVLAVTTVFEQYVELFVSWFPFYYLFKCMFLGLLLVPNTKVPCVFHGSTALYSSAWYSLPLTHSYMYVTVAHVLYDGFIEPGEATLKLEFDTNVQPLLEALVLKHGHWLHQQLLACSLQLFCDQELLELERELQDKLTEVRDEQRDRRRRLKTEQHAAIEGAK